MNAKILDLTVEVISSYVANHHVPKSELGQLLTDIKQTLQALDGATVDSKPEPAVDPAKTVHHDYLVCLECGRQYSSLRKHVMMKHGMEPEQYISKWQLPDDYPMISKGFSKIRSRVAKKAGLGERGKIERKHWRKYK